LRPRRSFRRFQGSTHRRFAVTRCWSRARRAGVCKRNRPVQIVEDHRRRLLTGHTPREAAEQFSKWRCACSGELDRTPIERSRVQIRNFTIGLDFNSPQAYAQFVAIKERLTRLETWSLLVGAARRGSVNRRVRGSQGARKSRARRSVGKRDRCADEGTLTRQRSSVGDGSCDVPPCIDRSALPPRIEGITREQGGRLK